jgi:hypothetical protein
MAGVIDDLTGLQTKEQALSGNKVSRFAYTQTAYDNNDVAGVPDYVWSREMNVPQGTPEKMKVSQTVIDKGWRTQADFLILTRMLMNHFLGRISYNLNKLHDNLLSLITAVRNSIGTAGGLATLGSDGYITSSQFPFRLNDKSPDAQRNIEILADDIETDELTVPDITDLGKVWHQSNITSGDFQCVYYADGIWVAGSVLDTGLWWSNDGKTWTQSNKTNSYFHTIYYADGIWVAGSGSGTGLWWSYDGKTWTQSNKTNASFFFNSVYYANGIWVAGSASGTGLWWSNDGKTWTQSNKTNDSFAPIYHADGIWVAGSFSGTGLWWSNDGKTWTQSDKNRGDFQCVYYADGIWVAGGSSVLGLWWSNDGKTWTQSNQTNDSFYNFYYADGIWVAGSYGAGLWWSNDGKTWTQSNKTNDSFFPVYYVDGIWVAGSLSGTGLCYSEPSGTTKDVEKIIMYLLSKVG